MSPILSLVLAIAATVWVLVSFGRNRAFMFASLFLCWQFALKVYGTTYVDLFGPVYSAEVFTEVGGGGASAPLMVLFVMIPLAIMKRALTGFTATHPPALERNLDRAVLTVGDVGAWLMYALLIGLFYDLFRLGTIPVLEGVERYDYLGGVFHQFVVTYTFLVAFIIGFCVVRARILLGVWDLRFFWIVLLLFFYLVLTGHRFGSFYVVVSFALVPFAALYVAPRIGVEVSDARNVRSLGQRIVRSRAAAGFFALTLGLIVLGAMANSLLNVRFDAEVTPLEVLRQRFLIQPVHLYWLTWDRLQLPDGTDAAAAFDFMFRNPFDAARNTGIQYLMFINLGLERASQVYGVQGVDYAGGYPEILIELVGVGTGLLAAAGISALVAWLYRLSVGGVARGHFATSVLALYVCFGVLSFFLGGMINFLTVWTYWIKVGGLIFFVVVERLLERRGARLIPWVLLRRAGSRRATPALGSGAIPEPS